jgi:hypothetical protein
MMMLTKKKSTITAQILQFSKKLKIKQQQQQQRKRL